MELNFLGIGSAFNPVFLNTSAYFVKEATLYLIDCGGTVFKSLWDKKVFEGLKKIVIFITHLHADHSGSLGTLVSYCKQVLKIQPLLIHPQENLLSLLDFMGISRQDYGYSKSLQGWADEVGFAFYPVEHSASLRAYGIVLHEGAEKIYYSGDAAAIPDKILQAFIAGEISRIYQDTSFLKDVPKGHGSYAKLKEAIPLPLRGQVYPIHWDKNPKDILVRDGFGLAMDVIVL